MTAANEPPLLSPTERPAAHVLNQRGVGPVVLVCEHASRYIPASLNGLGLSDEAATSHIAWDIGAFDLASTLSRMIDAPLVASRVSRLVYDCNRPPDAAGSIPEQSEVYDIPGNSGLSSIQRTARICEVYQPFCTLLEQVLDQRPTRPVLITIHSFTPVYNGRTRSVELGILHDADERAAQALLRRVRQGTDLRAQMNQPYSASDGVTHTLRNQAGWRGLANVMIEVRNDLIDRPEGVARIAGLLGPILGDVVRQFTGTREQGMRGATK